MSSRKQASGDTAGRPRTDRGFVIMLCSFLPVLTAFMVPHAYRMPFLYAGGAIFFVGAIVMYRKGVF